MTVTPLPVPVAGLPLVTPITPTTPFTTRDTDSYQTILRGLRQKVDALIEHVNESDAQNASNINAAIADLSNTLNLALQAVYNDLLDRVDNAPDTLANDPTTGKRNMAVSKVVGHVYDNNRIFAYFAGQYDAVGMTAAEYDALDYSARHYDLAPLYPTLNDVYEG